jgi:hypothetical protein
MSDGLGAPVARLRHPLLVVEELEVSVEQFGEGIDVAAEHRVDPPPRFRSGSAKWMGR